MRRALRGNAPVAVVMFDLDHFKEVNDHLGHELGDELLRAFGALLQKRTRGDDIACRYGGEELVLVFPGATAEVARGRADELREVTRDLAVQARLQPIGPVSVSAGVASLPDHGASAIALLRAADRALYRAKGQWTEPRLRGGRQRLGGVKHP